MTLILTLFMLMTNAFAEDSIPAGCASTRNFSNEAYLTWIAEGLNTRASDKPVVSPWIPLAQRMNVLLQPVSNNSREHKGYVNFEIPVGGIYIIATDLYPRLNLIEQRSGEKLIPTEFGKVRDCGSVNKALRFEFHRGDRILMELVSSRGPLLNVLIWKLQEI